MTELLISPRGTDAIQAGTIIDDDGQRFVIVSFTGENGDVANISIMIPTFLALTEYMQGIAADIQTRDYWRDHPRG